MYISKGFCFGISEFPVQCTVSIAINNPNFLPYLPLVPQLLSAENILLVLRKPLTSNDHPHSTRMPLLGWNRLKNITMRTKIEIMRYSDEDE